MWGPDRGGDLPLRLQFKSAYLRRSNRLLLQDEDFTFIVCLDELNGDQHRPRREDADPYPDVHRLAVPVDEHFLGATELLAHGIVDSVNRHPTRVLPTFRRSREMACPLLPRTLLAPFALAGRRDVR
jgi:hypothetical protein